MIVIRMPQVGQDIPTGTIVEWLKEENDAVEAGETVLIVESDKASFEIEADEPGILLKIVHGPGADVPILEPVGYIGQPGEVIEQETAAPTAPATPRQTAPTQAAPVSGRAAVASPSARRLARERGIDLARLTGSGPGGRIVAEDVEAYRDDVGGVLSEGDRVIPYGKMRKGIARRLTRSKQTIPHFYLFGDVDMTAAMAWRAQRNAGEAARLTVTDLVVKAVADSLCAHPHLNAHADDERIIVRKRVNIGVAVSVKDGLLVPVIADADGMNLATLSEALKQNVDAARRGMMSPGEEATFTVTSLGGQGVRVFVPIINPPECAILGVGSITSCVVPTDDPSGIGIRSMMTLTLACDHRAVDGVEAVRFLNEIKKRLEDIPGSLPADGQSKGEQT